MSQHKKDSANLQLGQLRLSRLWNTKQKRRRKYEQSLSDFWDTSKCAAKCPVYMWEYQTEEKKEQNNGQNLPNTLKTSPKCALICTSKKLNKLQVGNAKRSTPRHVTVKLLKAKERILKEKNDFV